MIDFFVAFILGICNGFQILTKLGILSFLQLD